MLCSRRGECIVLRGLDEEKSIRENDRLVIFGAAYRSPNEAEDAGRNWLGMIKTAFATANLGADFGGRAPQGVLTEHGKAWLQAEFGVNEVVNDVHGLQAYCEPRPKFARFEARVLKEFDVSRILTAVAGVVERGAVMSERNQLAYDLFSASSVVADSSDARFVMLMMAVESMLELEARPAPVRMHVETLIAQTEASGLSQRDISSIVGSLRWLFDESIGQAGRRLAELLGERRYGDQRASDFFKSAYDLRSRLVHGTYPPPDRHEVERHIGPLELFVRDLLSLQVIDLIVD